ncbi:MAG: hydantoinase/oxoprolinase family protein, partial [Deltaproteobacteria bacterium]|nr:hydantoinase/oxoprolinase family protein [Deltaproteobacteria bacterium]
AQGQTALIVDVGGTTTDITLIRDGAPVIREEGMVIGSWRTHVQAVEMYTVGLGGDSLTTLDASGHFTLGPARVMPLCQAHLHAKSPVLDILRDPESWIGPDLAAQCVALAPGVRPGDDPISTWLAANGPATPAQLRQELGLAESSLDKTIARLQAGRKIIACGFTPTDALHVLGTLHLGETAPARRGAGVLAARLGLAPDTFCSRVLEQASQTIATTILTALSNREVGPALAQFVTRPEPNPLLDIAIRLKAPVIGIGAAAPFLLPAVAKSLGTTVAFPDHFAVGNAVGAALMDRPQLTTNQG